MNRNRNSLPHFFEIVLLTCSEQDWTQKEKGAVSVPYTFRLHFKFRFIWSSSVPFAIFPFYRANNLAAVPISAKNTTSLTRVRRYLTSYSHVRKSGVPAVIKLHAGRAPKLEPFDHLSGAFAVINADKRCVLKNVRTKRSLLRGISNHLFFLQADEACELLSKLKDSCQVIWNRVWVKRELMYTFKIIFMIFFYNVVSMECMLNHWIV